jgi:osmotically-inducible protein OsmY
VGLRADGRHLQQESIRDSCAHHRVGVGLRIRFDGHEGGTGGYVDDSVITAKVKAAIYNDATLKVNEINGETFQGVVQLSGFVRSQEDIDKAVKVAREVAGVKSVKNDMRLK